MNANTVLRLQVATRHAGILIALAGAWIPFPRLAGQAELLEDQILTPSDPAGGQRFGSAVAVDGEWAVVGASSDAELGLDAGAAYVFERVQGLGWSQHSKLLDSNGEAGDRFGFSVAIDDEIIVVGAYDDVENGVRTGSATVFTRVNGIWSVQTELVPSTGQQFDQFGWSVAVRDPFIAVGARLVDLPILGLGHGAVYLFNRNGSSWVELPRLTSTAPSSSGNFGFSLSMSAEAVAIGTLYDRLEVFRDSPTGWSPDPAILAPISPSGGFGAIVSMSANRILTGARLDDEAAQNAGAGYIYLFDGINWTLEQKLMRANAQPNEFLGANLTLDSDLDLAVLTAPASDNGLLIEGIGTASVFEPEGSVWVETTRLEGSGFGLGEYTGGGLASSDRRVLLGFMNDNLAGPLSGSVYAYQLNPPFERGDCNQDDTVTIADPIFHLSALFVGGSAQPDCADACDGNDDGLLNIADPISVLGYLFGGSPPPPAPSPGLCGADPTTDSEGCTTSTCP